MKTIVIRRKRQLASMLVPFWVIPSQNGKDAFKKEHGFTEDLVPQSEAGFPIGRIDMEELDRIGMRIPSGAEAEFQLDDSIISVFASTMDGALSNEIMISDLADQEEILMVTKGGLKGISYPQLQIKRKEEQR